MSIKVKKFINENTTIWDNFINSSNNGTLFHYRSFLNYHENIQFNDHSLLFYEDNKLIALLPAAIKNDEFCSHPGISFGGFIFDKHLSFSNAHNIIKSFMVYINKINCKKIKITIPLVNKYCQGIVSGWSIFLTTYGPKDHNIPAIKTIGIATLGFFKFGIGSFYYYFISETRKYD